MYGCPHVDLTAAMDMQRGDYHKLFFCRNILGINECKEEKRLLQSLAVRRFLTSLCVSIFLQRRDSPLKKTLSRLSAGY